MAAQAPIDCIAVLVNPPAGSTLAFFDEPSVLAFFDEASVHSIWLL
jgi:hypothetical protein